jgi:2'-hydroxyisoflavone reductase
MRLLVLGGTAWLGHEVAKAALRAGDEVVCLARGGSGEVPPGARLVVGDRSAGTAAYDGLDGRFDAVVDVARQPGHVRGAVAALADRCERYLFVSSASVYADTSRAGATVDTELLPPLAGDTMESAEEYGSAKVACEAAVLDTFGGSRALLARAGLIGGPGDGSARTTYWPWRFAHPASPDGRVLVPDVPGLSCQVIDVRDVAAWLVESAREGRTGIVNASGDAVPLDEHLGAARAVAGHDGPVVGASPVWLEEQGVQPWVGPRSLPLWLPLPEYAGFGDRDVSGARELGLHPRPLEQTLADGLAWQRSVGAPTGVGLSDEEERELLAALA